MFLLPAHVAYAEAVLEQQPDLTLKGGRQAFSPRAAGAVLGVTSVTVKRLYDAGELTGEKIPSRGKKEFYAIYPESLAELAKTRAARQPARVQPAVEPDVMALLHAAHANSRIQELESIVARQDERLLHLQQRLEEAATREARLQEVIKQQSLQLQGFVAAQASMLDQL